jgi:hypothetical protein
MAVISLVTAGRRMRQKREQWADWRSVIVVTVTVATLASSFDKLQFSVRETGSRASVAENPPC